MRLRRYLGGATLGVAAILAVCAVLAALTSGTFFTDAEGAGSIGASEMQREDAVAVGEQTPTPVPKQEETPDDGGCCQPPDLQTPTPQPEPTDVPPTEEPPAPTEVPPTATPSGDAGGEGIGPPDTGSGPPQDSQGWMLIATLLAIGAAALGAAGVLTLKRAD